MYKTSVNTLVNGNI